MSKSVSIQIIFLEIRYEEFKERPAEFLCDIYQQFNIPGIERGDAR